jgi:hypothetical protein
MNKFCPNKIVQEFRFFEQNMDDYSFQLKLEENHLKKEVSHLIMTKKFLSCNIRKYLKDEKIKFRAQTAKTRQLCQNFGLEQNLKEKFSIYDKKNNYEKLIKKNGSFEKSYKIENCSDNPLDKIAFLIKTFKKI